MLDWLGGNGSEVGERTTSTLFRDVTLAAVGVLAAVLIMIIFFINPPKEHDNEKSRQRGNIRVEILWPDDMNVDIDLWTQAPGDVPVGYSNKGGIVFNLVRDDLGHHADLTGINYEISYSRGIPKGEYVVNIHWFGNSQGATSVPVRVMITIRKNDKSGSKSGPEKILTSNVKLTRVGQELTVARFKLDEDGNVVPGSLNRLPKKIRPYGSTGDFTP